MSLLTIIQAAADEVQIIRPATVAGNTSDDARRFLRYANKVGTTLMKSVNWQALRNEQSFTALNQETQTSILPSDFDRFVPETFWDRTNQQLLVGPVTSVRWQGLKAEGYDGVSRRFIHRGNAISVIPIPAGGEAYAFEYISNQWCESSGGAGQSAFSADTDVARIDEELITLGVIFEWLVSEGQPWQTAKMMYEERLGLLTRQDQSGSGAVLVADIFGGGRTFSGTPSTLDPGVTF